MDETLAQTADPQATDDAMQDEAAAADQAATADEAVAADGSESQAREPATEVIEPGPDAAPAGAETTESLGPDPLAKLEDDNSTFVLGMIPVVVVVVLALAYVGLYLHRRRKNWHELDEDMKIDGGDTPIGHSHFSTRDLQELEQTRPSQRMSEFKD